jgi:hypothetical protein
MAKRGAIVVGSLATLAFLSALVIAVRKPGSTITVDNALDWMNAALGLPSSLQTSTRASGRTYQIAIWQLADKQAILITSLSPKTVYAFERDAQDRSPQVLVESLPDDIATSDVAELAGSF